MEGDYGETMRMKPIPITTFEERERGMYIDEIRALCNKVITRKIAVSLTDQIDGPTMFAEEVNSYLRNGGKVKVYPTGNGGETINVDRVDRYEIHKGEVAYEF
jgi:hypothetical protein